MGERDAARRALPRAHGLDAEFYRHCAEGRLCFQRCADCGRWRHLPRPMCAGCGSPRFEWRQASGRGRVFSWTVTHHAPHPAFAGETPYVLAIVETEEGVRIVTRLRGVDPARVELGLPVQVEIERVSDAIGLPYFGPRAG